MHFDLKNLARALGGDVSRDQVLAPGPGHSPGDRSLSIKLSTATVDGFVVHSFAGDDPIICKDHVRQKLGVAAFKPKRHSGATEAAIDQVLRAAVAGQQRQTGGAVVAEYDYQDSDGTLLYQVVRLEPKSFRHRKPDGNGGWIWQGNERRVPYRWPELIKYPDATVFVCEGEKDADRVASLGHCATTMASGEWTPDCTKALAGRDCLILEDNDATGRKKAVDAATALNGSAKTIRIVRLPGLPDKGDVSDWLDADPGRVDKFVDVCFDAPVWKPNDEHPKLNRGGGERNPSAKFPLLKFSQLQFAWTEVAYVVKGWIPKTGLVVVWGPPKCGKSFWVMDLLLHVAFNWAYRGIKVTPGPIVYCAFEGAGGFGKRAAAFRKRHDLTENAEAPFYLSPLRMDLVRDHLALIDSIKSQLREDETPLVVALDTLNRSLVGSESKDEDMGAYIAAADAIREAFNCAVVIVHHCGIEASRPRGHTSLTGAVDVQIKVEKDENVIVTLEYVKDGEEGATLISRLEQVIVGADPDGDEVTSCVVVPADETEAHKVGKKLSGAPQRALDALFETLLDFGSVPPASSHIPANTRTTTLVRWEELFLAKVIAESTKPDSKKKAFVRAAKKLQELKIIEFGRIAYGSSDKPDKPGHEHFVQET